MGIISPKLPSLGGLKRKLEFGTRVKELITPKLRINPRKEIKERPFLRTKLEFECLLTQPNFWNLNQGKKEEKKGP